jgi:heptosyltransferase-2
VALDPSPLEDPAAGGGSRVSPNVPERVLVRAPNWVGDVVLSLPALRDLRRAFPAARLTVLARPWVADLYRGLREVDEVAESGGFRADVARVRGAFDAAVVLPNSFGTALVPRVAGVRERWGYSTDGRGILLTRAVRVPASVRGRSQVYYYRAMLAGVGIDTTAPPDASYPCPDDWRARGRELLGPDDGPWLGLNPGAFYGTAKRWLPERFAAVGDLVAARKGAKVVLLGGPAERGLAEHVAALMTTPARVLTGETSLPELLGVLANLRGFVTNDSGPMHLAAALGVPQVAVFGSTDWRETAPFGDKAILVREETECAPCMLRECPIDHRCMLRVSVDRVAAAAGELFS